jgi:hypothetical protein
MLRAPRSSRPARFLAVLWGTVLIGGLLGASVPPSASFAETPAPEVILQEVPAQDSATNAPAQPSTPSIPEEESAAESLLEVVFGVLILGPIIAIILGLLFAFPAILLGVSLVMDGGCLRYLLFGVGWIFSMIYGGIVGVIIGEMIGLEFLIKPTFYVFMFGYPVVAYWGHKKLQAMPDEQYRAWDQTLTGGALLGFGAGSIAGLVRSAASGFGGFGGGSFGGGGASGSWSGASGTAGSATSTAAGGTSSTAAGTATTAAGGASEAAAVATGAAPGVTGTGSAGAETNGSRGWWTRLRQWFQKFQWYHGLAFVLATLVFVPLGLGTMQALQNTKFFVFTLVCVVVYSGYKLLRRYPDAPEAALTKISSFHGGEASSSWS